MNHTPGPWEYSLSENNLEYDVMGGKWHVAITCDAPGSGCPEDNARLISAAPELLAACEEFVRKCECGEAKSKRSYVQMKAAIAKAKGEVQP